MRRLYRLAAPVICAAQAQSGNIAPRPSPLLSLGCHPARTDGVRAGNGAARCDG
jgi:hypothetical protein